MYLSLQIGLAKLQCQKGLLWRCISEPKARFSYRSLFADWLM